MKADNAQAPVPLGRPKKWVKQWARKGTILGPVEGHPNQFLVQNTATGRIVRPSAATFVKALDEPADAPGPKCC